MASTPALPANILWPGYSHNAAGTISITGATQKLAQRVLPSESRTLTHIDVRLLKTGTPGSIKIRFETESAGAPSGTLFAANTETGTFTPSATGWTGAQALTANMVETADVPYWIVLEPVAGTHDGSNSWSWYFLTSNDAPVQWQRGTYNGSAWTITSLRVAAFVVTISGGAKWGNLYYALTNRTVSGTTRVGLSFDVDVATVVRGLQALLSASNAAVGDLECKIFDTSDVQQGSTKTLSCADIFGGTTVTTLVAALLDFGADITLAAGKYWLSLHQAADASTHNWRVGVLQSDYSAEAEGRGGTDWQVGTRTSDAGAWTIPSPHEEGFYGPVFASQSGGSSGIGVLVNGGLVR